MHRSLGLCLTLLFLSVSARAERVEVSASQAIRVALVDGRDGGRVSTGIERTFGPRFEAAVARIYGARTQVALIRVAPDAAAAGLREGRYDAALLFEARVPGPIRRTGFHVLRAVPISDRDDVSVHLVLRQEQPELDELLANAFNVALHHAEVVRTLSDRRSAMAIASR